eukprot:g16987.t1
MGQGFLSQKVEQYGRVLQTVKKTRQYPQHGGPVGLDTDSSHNCLPGTLLGMAQRFSRGGVVDAEEPACFGTMAGDGVDPSAPVAKKRVLLCFLLPKDKKKRVFSAWFEIITDGNVGNFPILLGRPFLDSYSVNVCHDESPPCAVIDREEVDLFPAANIDMLEIEFIPVGCVNKRNVVTPSIPKPRKSKFSRSSDQEQLEEILQPARTFLACDPVPSMSKVQPDGENEYFLDLDEAQRTMLARSYMILAGEGKSQSTTTIVCTDKQLLGGKSKPPRGSPPKMLFDEGSEFDNLLFKKVLRSLNIFGHSIGLKSAFRISKLERMNEQHRKNIRKLTVSPYDAHVEALVWSWSSRSAIAESLDDVLEQFLSTKNDSDINDIDMIARRELNAEHLTQVNSTPILGTEDDDDSSSDDGAPAPQPLQSEDYIDPMADIPADEWTETPTHLVRWHYKPRTKAFVPLHAYFPELEFGKLTGERTTYAHFTDEPLVEYKYEDNWRRGGGSRRPSDVLHGQRKWVGRTEMKKVPSMFLQTVLPVAGQVRAPQPAPQPENNIDNNRETVISSGRLYDRIHPWAERFEAAEQAASDRFESVVQSLESSSPREGQPVTKRARTHAMESMESLFTASTESGEYNMPGSGKVFLAKQDRIIDSDHLHRNILTKLQHCVSTMELNAEGGQVLLTPAAHGLVGGVERAYDFTVLPTVSSMLEGKTSHSGRLMHTDKICWQFSQLLNGREISDSLNNKNNLDIDYVVTAVEIGKNKPLPQKYMGNNVMIRWGKGTTPEFVDEQAQDWSPVEEDFWVARVYYEVPRDAHEKMQLHTTGHKSSALEISEETARLLGFESYFVPSVRNEVRAVMKHGIFGESRDKKDVKDKNIMTSRLVVVIKVDLGTGKVSRIKSRWVSRGFQDRRFSGKKGEGLDCRSYTMSDSSFLFLLQFCQAMRSNVWFGDVTEAFLLGLSFLESYGEEYPKDPDSKVWMEVPKTIRGMGELNFKELVELVKSLYGCKDAPLNWMKTLRRVLAALQMKQSLIDPCLWCSFATEQEERIMKQGKEAVEKYYWERIAEIDKLDQSDIEGAAAIIGRQDEKCMHLPAPTISGPVVPSSPEPAVHAADVAEKSNSTQFENPATEKLAMSLTHHYQHDGTLLGALGSHVDDTCSGGHLLYMLRIYALFRKFPLGSWTKLTPGRRDSFIGRDVQVVPAEVDQHQMNAMLVEQAEGLERHDIQVSDNFSKAVNEEALLKAETAYGITRDQKPHTYEKADNLPRSADVLFNGWEMKEEVVFVVSQEAYAQKIKEVTREEVLAFFKGRDTAKNKWMRKKVENPFRKRIGEILWVTKSNCVIAAAASDLAGGLLQAEQANSWDAVKHYVNDLNGLTLLTSLGESSVRRVARIGDIHEHYLLGCGDASKSRVGGTLNLAGNLSMRLTLISSFSKIPRRVFSSSTGIELLAQRLLTSELLFALQIALDLHLLSLGVPFLQVGDNKNLLTEPNEKSLRLDYQALQQLREEKTLVMRHIPGKQNWSDALTKEPREVISLLFAQQELLDANKWTETEECWYYENAGTPGQKLYSPYRKGNQPQDGGPAYGELLNKRVT